MGNCQKNDDEIRSIQIVPPYSYLSIKCHTWNKDYQGLFDYESKDIEKEEIKVKQSGFVIKQKNSAPFQLVPYEELSQGIIKTLAPGLKFEVIRKPKLRGFAINSIRIEEQGEVLEKSIWEVVKSMPDKKYTLRQGDVIKLGRQKFRIKEKVLRQIEGRDSPQKNAVHTKYAVYENLTKQTSHESGPNLTEQEASQIVCRVCLDPGTHTNPLITPCKCQGYLKYIHLQCLKTWLEKRLQPSVKSHCVVINWKPLLCELCTSNFMYKVYLDGKKYYTVQIPRPEKPYIVLQILSKSSSNHKIYNLMSFAQKNKLRLGRKNDADIKISDDISVSRNHATITFDSKTSQFILEDNASKFGTLVLQKRYRLLQSTPIMFQVGPNLFTLRMVKGLDEPEQDQFSQSEKASQQDPDDSAYEESQESQHNNNDIAPEDLSPTLAKKAVNLIRNDENQSPVDGIQESPAPAAKNQSPPSSNQKPQKAQVLEKQEQKQQMKGQKSSEEKRQAQQSNPQQ